MSRSYAAAARWLQSRPIARAVIASTLMSIALGCSRYRELFPRHDDVFVPVPRALGALRVQGVDSTYVIDGGGYELAARSQDALASAMHALDRSSATFQRYFGEQPARVRVIMRSSDPRDSSLATAAFGDSSGTAVVLRVLAASNGKSRRTQGRAFGPAAGSDVTPVVHRWLDAWADTTIVREGREIGRAGTTADGASPDQPNDPRIPDWIELALTQMIADAPMTDLLTDRLSRQPGKAMALSSLFSSARPEPGKAAPSTDGGAAAEASLGRQETTPRPAREPGTLTAPMLFDAGSLAVTQFLVQREGTRFVGRLATALIGGESVESALRLATSVPRSVSELDVVWRSWLRSQHDQIASMRGSR